MKTRIEFIKRNRRLSIVLLILLITFTILFVIYLRKESEQEAGYSSKMEKIISPYPISNDELEITFGGEEIEIPKKERILTVTGFNYSSISRFLEDVYNSDEEYNLLEDFYVQFDNEDILTFASNTGIFTVSSNGGLPLNYKINSQEDIEKFLFQYFEVNDMKFEEDLEIKGGMEYKGEFIFKEIEIGSSYLNGNSFNIKVDDNGEIIRASILLLNDSNIREYQYLPLVSVKDLLTHPKYPQKIGDSVIENLYYKKPSPYVLTEYYITNITLGFVFNDFESKHIVPTYIIDGDARVKDSYKEKFWSQTRIFICAIDPSFLLTKQVDLQEEVKEQEGAPFVK